jgi:hypothetical protein
VPSPASAGGGLSGVVAISVRNVWAVGSAVTAHTTSMLILRWNGTAWNRVPGSAFAGYLMGVAAVSARDAWAVGNTQILRWNGTRWIQVPTPRNPFPGHGEGLAGVAVVSASDAWAVGYAAGGGAGWIVHWNGKAWK